MIARRHRPVLALLALVVVTVAGAPRPTAGAPGTNEAEPLAPLEVNDPAVTSGMAWHLDAIGARVAWRSSLGARVRVAVVDSGIDSTHPDLLGQVETSVSCIGAAGDPGGCRAGGVDESGHGTHVAGLIAARADDATGVAGVAPRATLLAVKALAARCTDHACTVEGDAGDLAAGVRWAVQEEADIVNLSVSAPYRLAPDLLDAIREAWEAGSVVVLAAGNRSDQPTFFDTSAALVVTATDREGGIAPYAPPLPPDAVAVAAPGGRDADTEHTCHETGTPVGLVSSFALAAGDGSGYACLAGTSMAAAQVSGGLALLLSMGYARDEAVDRLLTTVVPGEALGLGIIDLAAAVDRPYPPGVRNRHDAFATGVAPPPPGELPSVGPFSVPSEPASNPPSVWWFVIGGGLGLALVTELVLRLLGRRAATGNGAEGPADPTPPAGPAPSP
jgi:subtilisin family serine protease